ncbi:MAG: glycosyltransferase family 4 protein [Acidimicrobiales bacterium]
MSGIHQFVPMLHRHDAVGEHTRSLRDLLVAGGTTSRIYSELPDPGTVSETRPYRQYEADAEDGDILIYQFATESSMAGWLAGRPERLVLNYHSVTPPRYFAAWNNGVARLQVATLGELAMLAPRADLGIAVSHFDEGELRQAGCTRTTVIPVANIEDPPTAPDPATLARLEADGARRRQQSGSAPSWLSVGRLAPNKGHHETVAALFVATMTTDPGAHLTLVGSPSEPAYARALRHYVATLGLEGAVEFVTGIDDAELAAHYRGSDVLVMLSEHEGFGVPLVEAMGYRLPVVAFDAGAVREVLGDAGVLLDRKYPRQVATAVHRVLDDATAREAMVRRGAERFAAMDLASAGKRLVAAVRALPGTPTVPR